MTGNGLTNAQVKNAGSQHTKVAFTGRGPVCRKLETASSGFGGQVARLTRLRLRRYVCWPALRGLTEDL